MIEVPDEKRCNLEDDDSFEEIKAGHLSAKTPGCGVRKSSINATPKSRVIEPGAIFSSRQSTPASASRMRGRMGGFFTSKTGASSNYNAHHRHSRSNLIQASDDVHGQADWSRQ